MTKEKIDNFRKYALNKQQKFNISDEQIINMDEVPLRFGIPMSHTVDKVGKETISIITTGHEKSNFTCVLSITASGEKLPPMIKKEDIA